MLSRWTAARAAARCPGHDGYVPEVDDDQLAALRRLRAAFGPIEVEVVRHDLVVSNEPEDDRGGAQGSLARGQRWRILGG